MFRQIDIEKYVQYFETKYKDEEATLKFLFDTMHENVDFNKNLVKATTLNTLYSTQISLDGLKTIARLISENKEFDFILSDKKEELYAIDFIGKTKPEMSNAYVFASKYCSFHFPDDYLMFDSYSWRAIYTINKEENLGCSINAEQRMDLDAYKSYCDCVKKFMKKYGLETSYKKVDEFLWLYGKELKGEVKI